MADQNKPARDATFSPTLAKIYNPDGAPAAAAAAADADVRRRGSTAGPHPSAPLSAAYRLRGAPATSVRADSAVPGPVLPALPISLTD